MSHCDFGIRLEDFLVLHTYVLCAILVDMFCAHLLCILHVKILLEMWLRLNNNMDNILNMV